MSINHAGQEGTREFAPENIPEELRRRRQWVNHDARKIPQTPGTKRRADSTDSETWRSFEDAVADGRGLGFVFTSGDPYTGVDLDKCRDPETGVVEEWARRVVEDLDGYGEVSPSETGLHIIVRGKLPVGNNRRGQVEAYSSERYFTVTGTGSGGKVPKRQAELERFYREHLREEGAPSSNGSHSKAPGASKLSDQEAVEGLLAEKGGRWAALYHGDRSGYPTDSEADWALLGKLMFYCDGDLEQAERIARGSGLARAKWDEKRGGRSMLRYELERAWGDWDGESYTPPRAGGVLKLNQSGRERGPGNPGNPGNPTVKSAAAGFNLTDLGNASRLVAHHGNDLRYCYPWGSWLIWDGRRWSLDESGEIHRRAKRTVREIYREAADAADDETRKAIGKHAKASEAENRIQAMISLAKSEVPIMPAAMDVNPWLLNVEGGTVDLRTGELLEHRRDDLITKLAGEYGPEASASTWTATLERVLPSAEVRAFFKRLCGYAISGDVSEHVLPVLYGTGANGKSTILNALLEAAGEYGMQAAPDLLIAKRGGHPTEVADLFGMRFVASIEVEDGRRLAESLVKTLTGGDKVRARRMRQDFWQFDPTHTTFLCTNHKPEIRGTDTAIWRRIRLIPFTETIAPAEQDKKLPEKLRTELSGILAWAVEGCLEWQREGLKAPEEVRRATAGYRSEMDVVGAFLRDECEIGESGAEGYKATLKDVYSRYEEWCEEGGEKPETRRKFNARLTERGQFRDRRSGPGGLREWHGLKLLTKRNAAFAGKLTERSQNDYNGLVSSSCSVDSTKHVSTSVRQSEEPVHRDPGAWEGRF